MKCQFCISGFDILFCELKTAPGVPAEPCHTEINRNAKLAFQVTAKESLYSRFFYAIMI